MALDTLAGLKSAIGDWTGRKLNASFTANIPDFIRMAETRIFYGGDAPMETPPVRVLDMEKSKAIDVVAGTAKLPPGFLEFKRVDWISNEDARMEFLPARKFHEVERTGTVPLYYTIESNRVLVSPSADGQIRGVYYVGYDHLENNDDTNWLMENAPAVYLQAALIEAWAWVGNSERQQIALAAYRSAVGALNRQKVKARTSGEALKIRGSMW